MRHGSPTNPPIATAANGFGTVSERFRTEGQTPNRGVSTLTFASGLSSSFFSSSLACFFADRTSDLDETFWGAGLPAETHERRAGRHTHRRTNTGTTQTSHKRDGDDESRVQHQRVFRIFKYQQRAGARVWLSVSACRFQPPLQLRTEHRRHHHHRHDSHPDQRDGNDGTTPTAVEAPSSPAYLVP